MATHNRTVRCDNCNYEETAGALVVNHAKLFQQEGWLTIASVSPNGMREYYDLCPTCAKQCGLPMYTPIYTDDWRNTTR